MNSKLAWLFACSCLWAQQPGATMRQTAVAVDSTKHPSGDSTGAAHFATRQPRYQVEPGDTIELTFSPTVEYNQTISVQPDGFVTLREVGDLYVQGKTVPELRVLFSETYGKILNDPEITVLLKDLEKPHFTISGQVGKPGKYDLRAGTRVSEAVAIAGGMTDKAKDSQVLLFRKVSNDWVSVKSLDLKAIYKGRIDEDVDLHPGDMMFVPQNRISKIKPYLPTYGLSTYLAPGMF
jgi:polysaccharide export outer membrane protein